MKRVDTPTDKFIFDEPTSASASAGVEFRHSARASRR